MNIITETITWLDQVPVGSQWHWKGHPAEYDRNDVVVVAHDGDRLVTRALHDTPAPGGPPQRFYHSTDQWEFDNWISVHYERVA